MKNFILKSCFLFGLSVTIGGCESDTLSEDRTLKSYDGTRSTQIIDVDSLTKSNKVSVHPELKDLTEEELSRLGWRKVSKNDLGMDTRSSKSQTRFGQMKLVSNRKDQIRDRARLDELGITQGILTASLVLDGVVPGGVLVGGTYEYGSVHWDMYTYFRNDRAYAVSLDPVFKSNTAVTAEVGDPFFIQTMNLKKHNVTGSNSVSYSTSLGYSYTTSDSHGFRGGASFKLAAAPFGVGGESTITAEYNYTHTTTNGRQVTFRHHLGSSPNYDIPSQYKQRILIRSIERRYTETYEVPLTVEGNVAANYHKRVRGHYFWNFSIMQPFLYAQGKSVIKQTVTIEYSSIGAEVYIMDEEPMTQKEIEAGIRLGLIDKAYRVDQNGQITVI